MPAITVIPPNRTLPALPVQEVEAAKGFIAEQLAPATRRAYVSDARIFAAWCAARNVPALPAAPEAVATFLAAEATAGVKYATIARRAAAINFVHASAALDSPTKAHIVAAAMKGIRRSIGTAPSKKAPATANKVAAMADRCQNTLQGQRDRALLLLGFAGAFRRSELVALTVADIAEEPAGLRITIRKSKTDQEGAGQTVAIARGATHCPVAALNAWLAAAGIVEGPLFRPIGKGGRIQAAALTTKSVAAIVKRYAEAAGFAAADFAGHSLRAGFLTSAAEAGASIIKMCEVSRHRTIDVMRGYVRSAELFRNHAGAGLL